MGWVSTTEAGPVDSVTKNKKFDWHQILFEII